MKKILLLVSLLIIHHSLFAASGGVCAHITRPGGEFEIRDAEIALMRDAGITSVRSDFDWSRIQPRKDGNLSFTHFDAVLASLENTGVTLLPILGGHIPGFARPAHQNLDLWETYVRASVGRYRDRVPVWEVWNEPNLASFWKDPSPDDYFPLLKKTHETIKSIDPKLAVAIGGFSHIPMDYIERLYELGAAACFDIMNVHPYGHPGPPEEFLAQQLGDLRKLMSRHGDANKPVWITEIGWPTPRQQLAATGLVKTALATLRPNQKTPWRVAVLDDPAYPNTATLSDELLAAELPQGTQVFRLDFDALLAALPAGNIDAVMFPIDETFPHTGLDRITAYVRDGGILINLGGMPFHYRHERDASGKWIRADKNKHRLPEIFRVGAEAWWNKKGVIPEKMPVQFTGKNIPSPQGDIIAGRFLKPNKLKPGDRFIPLLAGTRDNYTGVAAAIIDYNSDWKGALILSAIIEPARHSVPEAVQAKYLPRAALISFQSGVEKFFWFELQSPEKDDMDEESHFGILHRDLTPKPAFAAYKTLIAQHPDGSQKLDRPWQSADGALYHPQWQLPDGRPAGAIWAYRKPGAYKLTFSNPGATFVSHLGEPLGVPATGATRTLHLADAPVYFSGAALESIESLAAH